MTTRACMPAVSTRWRRSSGSLVRILSPPSATRATVASIGSEVLARPRRTPASRELVVDSANVHGAQQARQPRLAPGRIPPHLSKDDRGRAKPHPCLLGGSQPGDHRAASTLDGDEGAGVQHEGAHSAGASTARPNSTRARCSSSAVKAPCSCSQSSRTARQRLGPQFRLSGFGEPGGERLVVAPRGPADCVAEPGLERDADLVHSHGRILPR